MKKQAKHLNSWILGGMDYYPFGMVMPGRSFTAGTGYRYGFNGKENDNEVKGNGNQQDYGMRVYDPRFARFLSTDPLTRSYPMLTPYQFASNRPLDGIDKDGMEWQLALIELFSGATTLEILTSYALTGMMIYEVQQMNANMERREPIYLKYNPDYDWQKRRDKQYETLLNARNAAMKKDIDNFQSDDNDPDKFKKIIKNVGGIVAGAYVLDELLLNMKETIHQHDDELKLLVQKDQNKIQELRAQNNLSDNDTKSLNALVKVNLNNLVQLQANEDALKMIDEIRNYAKQQQESIIVQVPDNTNAPPSGLEPILSPQQK